MGLFAIAGLKSGQPGLDVQQIQYNRSTNRETMLTLYTKRLVRQAQLDEGCIHGMVQKVFRKWTRMAFARGSGRSETSYSAQFVLPRQKRSLYDMLLCLCNQGLQQSIEVLWHGALADTPQQLSLVWLPENCLCERGSGPRETVKVTDQELTCTWRQTASKSLTAVMRTGVAGSSCLRGAGRTRREKKLATSMPLQHHN